MIKKFFNLIKFRNDELLDSLTLKNMELDDKNDILFVEFASLNPPKSKYVLELLEAIENAEINNINKIYYSFKFDVVDKEDVVDYYKLSLSVLSRTNSNLLASFGYSTSYLEEAKTLKVIVPNDDTSFMRLKDDISSVMERLGIDNIELSFEISDKGSEGKENIKQATKELYKKMLEAEYSRTEYEKYNPGELRGTTKAIKDLPDNEDEFNDFNLTNRKSVCLISGTIEFIDKASLDAASPRVKFVLYDGEEYVFCVRKLSDKDNKEYFDKLKPGMTAHVQCYPTLDNFSNTVSMRIVNMEYSLVEVPVTQRTDEEEEKRVELNLHTKMSAMDGVAAMKDYVALANIFKHKALAVTDFASLQSFHELQIATEKVGIKPLFGVELNYVDEDDIIPAYALKDINLDEATYVVYDLETTGISVNYEKIIEISAVKIYQNQIIDRFSELVNPEKEIHQTVVNLTTIHQSDVNDKRKRREVLTDFLQFIKGTILVAHNASFDISHLYKNLDDLSIEHEDFPVIDTWILAKILYPSHRKYSLDAVAKRLGVELKQHHRALDDATCTGEIFLHMLVELKKRGIRNHKDINSIVDKNKAFTYPFPTKINLLIQNHDGFINLNKIMTEASTIYYNEDPVVTKKVIEEYRDGILVGSGNRDSYFWDVAFNESPKKLEKIIQFYDYIEVQPVASYMHYQFHMCNYEYCVQDTIKRIISLGHKYNIPVCATSNCYQLNEEDTLYRRIMVKTPGSKKGGIAKYHLLEREQDIPNDFYYSTREMLDAFEFVGKGYAKEIVIDNTNKIADMCEKVVPFVKIQYAPKDDFMRKIGIPSAKDYLIETSFKKAYSLYGDLLPGLVLDRINQEKDSITNNNYSTIYLISDLLVKKSRSDGYVVGSRGSVGSSFIAYLMDITEVNSLPPHYRCSKCHYSSFKMTQNEKTKYGLRSDEKELQKLLDDCDDGFDLPDMKCPVCGELLTGDGHDIPFETFLGFPDKPKTPDIDLNFSGENQGTIHNYIRELFGENKAFRAGTILTIKDQTTYAIVRDYFDLMNKMHPEKPAKHRGAELEALATKISEIKKTSSQHPGGIVVVPEDHDISEVTSIQYPGDSSDKSWKTTHFEYHSFEENLFKLDVLGHDDPTVLKYLMKLVHAHQSEFDFTNAMDIPIKDKKVFKLMSETEVINVSPDDIKSKVATYGISEFGTNFVRDILEHTHPSTFAGLLKISGLSHGQELWKGNSQDLIDGKVSGFPKISFRDVIGCRDDIMINLIRWGVPSSYAFKIMEFCRKGNARKEKVAWEEFANVLRTYKVPEWYIWSCSKIKYLFPKAHATAYVMSALRIAWFKIYKPLYFYSAVLSKKMTAYDVDILMGGASAIKEAMAEISSLSKFDRKKKQEDLYTTLELALEMCSRGFKFYCVDIYKSDTHDFVLSEDGTGLYLPFVAIDSLGENCGQSIINARNEKPFSTIADFMKRTITSKTIFDKFKTLGCFDGLPEDSQISLDLGL